MSKKRVFPVTIFRNTITFFPIKLLSLIPLFIIVVSISFLVTSIRAASVPLLAPPKVEGKTITWDSFTETEVVCGEVCIREEWTTEIECGFDSTGNQWCETRPVLVCVQTEVQCQTLRKELPFGDLIDVTIRDRQGGDSSVVYVILEIAEPVTWWKALRIFDCEGRNWEIYNDAAKKIYLNGTSINLDQLECAQIEFRKAGFLGFKYVAYNLSDLASRLHGGQEVTFRWVKD